MVDDFCITNLAPDYHCGPQASLSRSEVITLAIFGQWERFASERDFYRFARERLRGEFPTLPARSQFNRLMRRHRDAIMAFALSCPQPASDYEALDTLPVTVRQYKRRGWGWLAGQADIGFSKRISSWFCGFRLLAAVNPQGEITGFGFGSASAKDQPLAETMLAARHTADPRIPSAGVRQAETYYLTDKGFEGKDWQYHWRADYEATVIHAPRRNSRQPWHEAWRKRLASLRQIVETVFSKLTNTFRLHRERPHELTGFAARLAAKVALHNFCIRLNRLSGRHLLAFADLLGW
jgi:hypothetical protein